MLLDGPSPPTRRVTSFWQWLRTARDTSADSPILLVVDEPPAGVVLGGTVHLTGSVIGPSPIVRLELLCDDEPVSIGSIGHLRSNGSAIHAHLPNGDRSGFVLDWNAAGLGAGPHSVAVRAVDSRGRTTQVVVRSCETPPVRLRLNIDRPIADGALVSGSVPISGWTTGPVKVVRIDVLCDGEHVGATSVGMPRPDVEAALPGFRDADRSGFEFVWDTSRVPLGPHVIAVRAVDASGSVLEVERRVEVNLPLQLEVEEPPYDEALIRGPVCVSGWAAGPFLVARVEVECDGRPVAAPDMEVRGDVSEPRSDSVDGARSLFEVELKPRPAPGMREITVRAIDVRSRIATVTRRVLVAPARTPGTRPVCRSFALYTSSLGNYFFWEIRDLLAAGLRELGFAVEIRDERYGFSCDADWHIVVAPHEFFYLGTGQGLLRELPQRAILLNTEQPSTRWFALASDCFSRAHTVWDINVESSRIITERGHPSRFLPLGFSAAFEAAAEVRDLPQHSGTCFLEPEVRKHSSDKASLHDRPLDILFVGHASRRRELFFGRAAELLSRYRCYLHLANAAKPIIPGQTTHLNTSTVMGLAQRSKIVLNLHHGIDKYFEWHRIVIGGIWQRALVITEPCGIAPPFQAGADFIEAPLEDIPKSIAYYLSSETGRREAENVARHGFQTLTEKCRLAECLRELILHLHDVPRFPEAFSAESGNGADHSLPHAHSDIFEDRTPSVRHDIEHTEFAARMEDVENARQELLASGDLSKEEQQLLSSISVEVHSADEMYERGRGHHYVSVGLSAYRCVRSALRACGVENDITAILDFPCGYGRVLRFLRAAFPNAKIFAGEIQKAALDFNARRFSAHTFRSTTDFTRLTVDERFDLIWCGSLLTHLDESHAVDLLRFFRRHLTDRGVCVFTTHGSLSVDWILEKKYGYGLTEEGQERVIEEFREKGYGYVDYPNRSGYGIAVVSHSHMVELAKHAGDWAEVLHLEHGWAYHQDLYAFAASPPGRI